MALDETNIIRLIDFPEMDSNELAEIICKSYPYGIEEDFQPDENSRQIELKVRYHKYSI